MANEFVIKRGYISQGDSSITGSLVVTGGVTGSFSGSFIGDGSELTGVDAFPFTGSAIITGSLAVTGSVSINTVEDGGSSASVFNIKQSGSADNYLNITGTGTIAFKTRQFYNGIDLFNGGGSQLALRTYAGVGMIGINGNGTINFTTTRASVGYGNYVGPQATLDVKSHGALSTDIAFRVRNSANTADIFLVSGDGLAWAFGAGLQANNAAFGRVALASNTTGIDNTAFGTAALNLNTIGGNNTAVGRQALANSVIAGSNTAIGRSALISLVTGNNNVALGSNSGALIADDNALTNSTNSVFLGVTARAQANNQTNQIVIGQGAVGLGSNTTVIGNGNIVLWRIFGAGLLQNVTAPALSVTDNFHIYSADITAGNAAPHFRTENGSIIKLYQQSAVTSSQGLADVLTNVGLLATGSSIATAFERLSDFQSPYHYSGNATLGTSTSSTSWIINRIDFTTPGSPITLQGTGSWDNRTSLIYS
jgi:hypothetical protein